MTRDQRTQIANVLLREYGDDQDLEAHIVHRLTARKSMVSIELDGADIEIKDRLVSLSTVHYAGADLKEHFAQIRRAHRVACVVQSILTSGMDAERGAAPPPASRTTIWDRLDGETDGLMPFRIPRAASQNSDDECYEAQGDEAHALAVLLPLVGDSKPLVIWQGRQPLRQVLLDPQGRWWWRHHHWSWGDTSPPYQTYWDEILAAANRTPRELVLGGLRKSRGIGVVPCWARAETLFPGPRRRR